MSDTSSNTPFLPGLRGADMGSALRRALGWGILAVLCVASAYALALPEVGGVVVMVAIGGLVAALTLRFVGAWIFLAGLIVVLNQSRLDFSGGRLNDLRWLPLFYFAALLLGYAANHGRLPRQPYRFDLWILGWTGFAMLTAILSLDPVLTLQRGAALLLMYAGVFWILWAYADRTGEERVIGILLALIAFVYATSALMFLVGMEVFQRGRLHGMFGNPNTLGWLTALLYPLALVRARARGGRGDKLLFASMPLALLLTGSRGAIVAVALVTLDVLWRARSRWVWGVGLLLVWVALSFWGITPMPQNFESYVRMQHLATGSGRLEAWPVAVKLLQERPMTGFGFGTEDLLLSPSQYSFQEFRGWYFHNSFIGLAVQVGIPATVCFFLPLVLLLLSERSRTPRGEQLSARVALQGVLLVGLVACMFESWIYSMGNALAFPFWLCMMLLIRARMLADAQGVA